MTTNGPGLKCILRPDLRQTGFDRRRALACIAVLAAATAAGGLLWAILRGRADRSLGQIAGARWIWFSYGTEHPEPIRFFAGREFRWSGGGAASTRARARALVFVDRQYVLTVNGRRVGSGGQKPGDRLDAYDLSGLVRPGSNRIVLEAESPTGAGGILFSLKLPSGDRIVSDRAWRVGLVEGDLFSRGAAPIVWGRPPMYPWGYPAPPASTAAAIRASRAMRAAAQ